MRGLLNTVKGVLGAGVSRLLARTDPPRFSAHFRLRRSGKYPLPGSCGCPTNVQFPTPSQAIIPKGLDSEAQGGCLTQPTLGYQRIANQPQRRCTSKRHELCNPFRVETVLATLTQGRSLARQPWALECNPFGIKDLSLRLDWKFVGSAQLPGGDWRLSFFLASGS